jgi:suppressor for copper-sensitivity B
MVEGNHDRLSLRIRLVSTGMPFAAPDLFVEGRKEAFFGRPAVALSDRGHDAELTVPVSGTSRAELLGNPLTLTLVDGARAAEFSVTPVTGTAAE